MDSLGDLKQKDDKAVKSTWDKRLFFTLLVTKNIAQEFAVNSEICRKISLRIQIANCPRQSSGRESPTICHFLSHDN